MAPASTQTVTLTCHPVTPTDAVHRIDARVSRMREGTLRIAYDLHADLTRLRVPPPAAPRIVDGLWRHTCFELFIRRQGADAYHELNFSPSREWAAYAFARYREGAVLADEKLDPRVTSRLSATMLALSAAIPLDRVSPAHASASLALAISAVVEASDGTLSYWALRHPPGRPDFHHADGYAIDLI
jgi:hypothetical protein